jgi:hypothetical protein
LGQGKGIKCGGSQHQWSSHLGVGLDCVALFMLPGDVAVLIWAENLEGSVLILWVGLSRKRMYVPSNMVSFAWGPDHGY